MFPVKNISIAMLVVAGAHLGVACAAAPEAVVTPLMEKPLTIIPARKR
ncbi:hypothetical protein HDG37_006469 [Paraburkholderia sp. MM5384-R2]|nr:hypothetical protein [Paraburkholderia sp. MM5384-R2]